MSATTRWNAHLCAKPLTPEQDRALKMIGDKTVHVRDLVNNHVGRTTLRALERRGLAVQVYDRFRATDAGLAKLGLIEDIETGDL